MQRPLLQGVEEQKAALAKLSKRATSNPQKVAALQAARNEYEQRTLQRAADAGAGAAKAAERQAKREQFLQGLRDATLLLDAITAEMVGKNNQEHADRLKDEKAYQSQVFLEFDQLIAAASAPTPPEPTRPERISYAVFCLKKKKALALGVAAEVNIPFL